MRSLYESITQSRFTRRDIGESILDDDEKIVKTISTSRAVQANLETCDDISQFKKLWRKLGLNLEKRAWRFNPNYHTYEYHCPGVKLEGITCSPRHGEDPPKIDLSEGKRFCPENFDVRKYAEKVAAVLNMNIKYNGAWYELTFK